MTYKQLLIAGMVISGFVGCTPQVDNTTSKTTYAECAKQLKIVFNATYPSVAEYSFNGKTMKIAQPETEPVVVINNKAYKPVVSMSHSSPNHVSYKMVLDEIKVTLIVDAEITDNVLTFTVSDVIEEGDVMVRHINLPGLVLLNASAEDNVALGNFPVASYSSNHIRDLDFIGKVNELKLGVRENKNQQGEVTASYPMVTNGRSEFLVNNQNQFGTSYSFVSNGELSAGVYSNVMNEDKRFICTYSENGIQVAPGTWSWRENPPEIIAERPTVKIIFADDLNDDNQVTWQDSAIAYRHATPAPYGYQNTPNYLISHIAMNFGSQATFPFLRVLDNAKKIWLYTDGLGQRIQYKGFAGEGHDSSHPDYAGNVGRRMGGREDLNFAMRRGHDFNVLSGVHINAHEYHPEAKEFKPSLIGLQVDPKDFKPEMLQSLKTAWCWLDESYHTDYYRDAASGEVANRLERMREDLPYLDFAYLDVYFGRGWPAYNMHKNTNGLGIMQHTEFPGVMERAVIWNHVANDWTQAIWGRGDQSGIARFIYNSRKDTFGHNPLLRGANCDGFMGWHGEHNMMNTINSAFTVNLPTKYLQNFELLKVEEGVAYFSNGVYSTTEWIDDGKRLLARIYNQDGQLINSCCYDAALSEAEAINYNVAYTLPWETTTAYKRSRPVDNQCFIPWNPKTEDKIYHWNDLEGATTWEIPSSWNGLNEVYLYRLTDTGRVFEGKVPVKKGKVTLNVQAKTPYVLYKNVAPAVQDVKWSEKSLVKDMGFDSHSFNYWKPIASNNEAKQAIIENDQFGQTMLTLKNNGVTQVIEGLEPGKTYSLSVWTSVVDQAKANLSVLTYIPTEKYNYVDKSKWRVTTTAKCADAITNILDNSQDSIWHTSYGANESDFSPFPHSFIVKLDKPRDLVGIELTARKGLGNGAIATCSVEYCENGTDWVLIDTYKLGYTGDTAVVNFGKKIKTGYIRVNALSEIRNQKFSSLAEFNILEAGTPNATQTQAAAIPTIIADDSISNTILPNFTDQSSKYKRNWHRMKVVFTAPENGKAVVALQGAATTAAGKIHFDDVRLVRTEISKPATPVENCVLFEDFENVDEGWGPFMYGWQGPMNTHLSETNLPYTDDTIGGEFSLKTRNESPGNTSIVVYRTVPATLKLKPNTTYRIRFDYKSRDTDDVYYFIAGHDKNNTKFSQVIKDSGWTVQKFDTTFTTDADGDWFIGVYKKSNPNKIDNLVIDNILLTEEK